MAGGALGGKRVGGAGSGAAGGAAGSSDHGVSITSIHSHNIQDPDVLTRSPCQNNCTMVPTSNSPACTLQLYRPVCGQVRWADLGRSGRCFIEGAILQGGPMGLPITYPDKGPKLGIR